jgi:phage tail sheath gpL-like
MTRLNTAISPGSIASGVGVETVNQQFRNRVSRLPVRIALLAQPGAGVVPVVNGFSYDLPKQVTSPDQAATIFGFGSPVHLAALVLFNANQSIGTLPLDVFAIKESDQGKAQGTVTLDTQPTDGDTFTVDTKIYTLQSTLTNVDGNIQIGSTLAETQANIVNAFNLSGAAGVDYAANMTAHPTVDIAAFVTNAAVLTARIPGTAGNTIVTTETFTSPSNQFDAATLGTTTAGSQASAAGQISFVGTQVETQDYTLKIGSQEISFTLFKNETALEAATKVKALIDGNVKVAVNTGAIVADAIPLEAKWPGATGNEIGLEFEGVVQGMVVNLTQMAGGVGNADVSTAVSNFQEFYTMVVNAFDDSGNLDALEVQNEIFWSALEHRPFIAYYGSKETDPTLVSTDTESRLNERTNAKFPVPGSPSTHVEIAASVAAHIAVTSSDNPPKPYNEAVIYGILPGNETVIQWTYAQRDFINKRGCSTSFLDKGLLKIGDVLTTYHPVGVDFPGYSYAVDIAKVQVQLSDLSNLFEGPKWSGKILVGNRDEITNPEARRPFDAKTDAFALIDSWGQNAIIKNPDFAKDNTQAEIDPGNPNRLNVNVSSILSGAARIRSIKTIFSTEVGV